MSYENTQKSPLGWILFVTGVLILLSAIWVSNQTKVLMFKVAFVVKITDIFFLTATEIKDTKDVNV